MKNIPIKQAEGFAIANDLKQVIIFGHDGEQTHIVTWGDTVEHSAQAAAGANHVKKLWGWPAVDVVESSKVKALRDRIAELEATVATLNVARTAVWVIEGTELERGWGSRPDGIVAFLTKADAEAWIIDYNRRFNNKAAAPDVYTTYSNPKLVEVAGWVRSAIAANEHKCLHKQRLSELE